MDRYSIPYKLLADYFSGHSTALQRKEVELWRKESMEHETLFQTLKKQWDSVHEDTSSLVIPDKTVMWEKIQQKIKAKQIPLYTRTFLIRISGIAAAIALVIGFGLAVWTSGVTKNIEGQLCENTVFAPSGQKSQLILPDGTQVWLNSGSRLTYNYQYNTKGRTVKLEGEAFFDVKHNEVFPFVVQTGTVDVKVHGTAFNVQAYRDEDAVSVALLRGKVSLQSSDKHEFMTYLSPGQSAIVSKSTGKWRVKSCDAEIESSWHLDFMKFEGATAEEVWKKLGRWYGVEVQLSDVNPLNTYWFTVKTETLTEMLEMINKLTPMEYSLNGKEVMIRYK